MAADHDASEPTTLENDGMNKDEGARTQQTKAARRTADRTQQRRKCGVADERSKPREATRTTHEPRRWNVANSVSKPTKKPKDQQICRKKKKWKREEEDVAYDSATRTMQELGGGTWRFGHLVAETPLSIGARARTCLGTGTKPRVFRPLGGRNTRVVTSGCSVHPDR
ncbi:uncharacterized protein G2W53_026070 [Senna tora]|uniref:Uncharacterized protein n=1 Tax=Senna tora TaxID=362788 RepID=A0A834TGV2_9FABA|nr:uncharacterized protein G2W53_026070 [Senna tora]